MDMRKILLIGIAALFICGTSLLLIGCGGKAKEQPAAQTQANSDLGEQLYMGQAKPDVNCAKCHEGGQGPELSERINSLTDEEILKVMENGKVNMPAFGAVLVEKERIAILGCLRAKFHDGPGQDIE